jgi:tetratricopeptide (TPR) repeat protein
MVLLLWRRPFRQIRRTYYYGKLSRDGAMIKENYEKAILKYPYNAKFYYNLGVFHYATKNYESAIRELDKGIAFKPFNIEFYYYYRALAEIQLQNTNMAVANLKSALKFNPDNKDVKKVLNGLR